jgi:hypothetical protein
MVVWSFKKILELKDRPGFVECPKDLAEKLIADGHAQDPKVGGAHLKQIDNRSESSSVYEVKVMEPKKKTMSARKKASEEEGDK